MYEENITPDNGVKRPTLPLCRGGLLLTMGLCLHRWTNVFLVIETATSIVLASGGYSGIYVRRKHHSRQWGEASYASSVPWWLTPHVLVRANIDRKWCLLKRQTATEPPFARWRVLGHLCTKKISLPTIGWNARRSRPTLHGRIISSPTFV